MLHLQAAVSPSPGLRDLSSHSLRTLTEALPPLYAQSDLSGMARTICDTLAQLVPGESHGVVVLDRTTGQRSINLRPASADHESLLPRFFAHFAEFAPANFRTATHCGDALALSDFISTPARAQLGIYQEYYQPLGLEDDLSIRVERGNTAICAAVARKRLGFHRDERSLMNALRPHLGQAWDNASVIAQLKLEAHRTPTTEQTWTPGPLMSALGLTPRESEVLLWVAQGKTNNEVGSILGIRPYTVRTHLERIFAKLGVETRHAAAIAAIGVLGLPASN